MDSRNVAQPLDRFLQDTNVTSGFLDKSKIRNFTCDVVRGTQTRQGNTKVMNVYVIIKF